MNKEMKYKLVVHDHLDSVVHCKTVKRKREKERERKKERKKERERAEKSEEKKSEKIWKKNLK